MIKNLTISALLLFSATTGLAQGESTLYKTIKENYENKADSMVNAFIESFMIKNKGVFNDMYQKYAFNAYWTQAHAMDVIVYCYERHKDDNKALANKYKNYMSLWYSNKANNYAGAGTSDGTYKMFENPFTDDMCWITLTLLHMNEATGTTKYYTAARGIFDNYIIKRAKEDEETGGLWLPWNTNGDGNGPNACTQSPATLIAAKLYQKTNLEKYLTYAKKLYAYTAKKIVKSDGRVEEPPLTYTQGTFGEACRILYHVTDETPAIKNRYKTLAFQYISYAFTSGRCTNGQNILRHEGTSGDQSIFKAVLIPYAVNYVLDTEMPTSNRKAIAEYIQKNTKTLYANLKWDRYPIVFCNFDWTKPWTGEDKDASRGAMCSGTSLLENTARMQKAIIESYQDYQDIIEDIPANIDIATTTGVYTIDGRLVRTPWQGTDNLPKGMYIINGKKVFLK